MTLGDLADFVCGKVNQTEAEDLAKCKEFFQRRFGLLWNTALWKDSLVSYTQTLSPTGYTPASSWLPNKSILLVPPLIQRVIAVRSDTRRLNVQRAEFYYRVDLDVFARTGTPSEFVLLPPCAWELDSAYDLVAKYADAADNALELILDTLNDNGIDITRQTLTLALAHVYAGNSDRIDTALKEESEAAVTLSAVDPDSVTISGAGTDETNGTYDRDGELNGKPLYGLINDGINIDPRWISWNGSEWTINTTVRSEE